MVVANFRFYEELNDFLPSARRKRDFACVCVAGTTAKQAIEALGVPPARVELILVNGESVDFSYVVQVGDRFSVYPVFESLDVTPVVRVRTEPLRRTRFIADARLGRLARYLRALGFDTLYDNAYTGARIACIAAAEQRIVLTRDGALLTHERITHGCHVRETRPRKQLEEIVSRLDLDRAVRPFGRCPRCNADLSPVVFEMARDRLPALGVPSRPGIGICGLCERTWGEGSPWRRMEHVLGDLLRRSRAEHLGEGGNNA